MIIFKNPRPAHCSSWVLAKTKLKVQRIPGWRSLACLHSNFSHSHHHNLHPAISSCQLASCVNVFFLYLEVYSTCETIAGVKWIGRQLKAQLSSPCRLFFVLCLVVFCHIFVFFVFCLLSFAKKAIESCAVLSSLAPPGKDWCSKLADPQSHGNRGSVSQPENGIFNPPLDCPWQVGEDPEGPSKRWLISCLRWQLLLRQWQRQWQRQF